MSLRHFSPGIFSRLIFPRAVFRLGTREKILCLTFDDGPDPDSTDLILKILSVNNVTALFFCTGEKAEKYPDLLEKIRRSGHVLGNHGYRHLDGWKTGADLYLENAVRGASITGSNLFRPPYGRMTPAQYREMSGTFLVMLWDLMPYDFDSTFEPHQALDILTEKTREGSVIVLHDSPESTAPQFLNEYIRFCRQEGFRFVVP